MLWNLIKNISCFNLQSNVKVFLSIESYKHHHNCMHLQYEICNFSQQFSDSLMEYKRVKNRKVSLIFFFFRCKIRYNYFTFLSFYRYWGIWIFPFSFKILLSMFINSNLFTLFTEIIILSHSLLHSGLEPLTRQQNIPPISLWESMGCHKYSQSTHTFMRPNSIASIFYQVPLFPIPNNLI